MRVCVICKSLMTSMALCSRSQDSFVIVSALGTYRVLYLTAVHIKFDTGFLDDLRKEEGHVIRYVKRCIAKRHPWRLTHLVGIEPKLLVHCRTDFTAELPAPVREVHVMSYMRFVNDVLIIFNAYRCYYNPKSILTGLTWLDLARRFFFCTTYYDPNFF